MLWNEWDIDDYESEWEAIVDFMSEKYQTALKQQMKIESLKEMKAESKEKTTMKCFACNKMGHKSKFCPKTKEDKKIGPKVTANKASISSQDT